MTIKEETLKNLFYNKSIEVINIINLRDLNQALTMKLDNKIIK
jgi:Tfp pilus assembly protein PilO